MEILSRFWRLYSTGQMYNVLNSAFQHIWTEKANYRIEKNVYSPQRGNIALKWLLSIATKIHKESYFQTIVIDSGSQNNTNLVTVGKPFTFTAQPICSSVPDWTKPSYFTVTYSFHFLICGSGSVIIYISIRFAWQCSVPKTLLATTAAWKPQLWRHLCEGWGEWVLTLVTLLYDVHLWWHLRKSSIIDTK